MTRGSEPGTAISRAHSSGTRSSPSRRAATAGNSASRSSVTVKMQLTIASAASSLRSITSRISSSVAARIAGAVVAVHRDGASQGEQPHGRGFCQGGVAAEARRPLDLGRRAGGARRAPGRPARAARTGPARGAHRMADGLAHALDLAVAPLVDRQLEQPGLDAADARGRREPVLELDALAQRAQRGRAPARARRAPVGLGDLVARMREQVRQLAVVGQQDQARWRRRRAARPGTGARATAPGRPPWAGRACRGPWRPRRGACATRTRRAP